MAVRKKNTNTRVTVKTSALAVWGHGQDPVEWVEENLGMVLYTNQITDLETFFDKTVTAFSVVACRGAGKSVGLSAGIIAFCMLHPGLRVIIAGPKEKQAGRIIKEMVQLLRSKRSRIIDDVDWGHFSALRLPFLNGSSCVAVSGQEGANIEGEHGHVLVIDESHLVPTYSVTNKLTPMIGMLDISKLVKIGVAMGRNHFYKSCTAEDAVVNKCPWNKAEIFTNTDKENLYFYKDRPYAKSLVNRMPLPYKQKYFVGRPDLQKITGQEISVMDWETQYELIWAEDILNFLSDEDQELLSDGAHHYMTKGVQGEVYVAGLDTAQGSLTGRSGTDETVLSIWRLKNGVKEKIASFVWLGDPLSQLDEIWEIINPVDGIFKCRLTLVDYSNIGIAAVEIFRRKKMPISGKHFASSDSKSRKNFKNALFDHFSVELQLGRVKFPDIKKLETARISAEGEHLTQILNLLDSWNQWLFLQRIRGKGLNDKIEAPSENTEDKDGKSSKGHDDHASADCLAVWAADNLSEELKLAAKGGDLSNYSIPTAIVGNSASHAQGGGGSMGGGTAPSFLTQTLNPIAQADIKSSHSSQGGGTTASSEESWLGNILGGQTRRK